MSADEGMVPYKKVGFMKLFFSSCLGTAAGLGLLGLLFISIGGAFSEEEPVLEANSVLKLNLGNQLPEHTDNTGSNSATLETLFDQKLGLTEICKLIDHAKTDDRIKGIYLESVVVPGGWVKTKTIRQKLEDFKASGKFVISYGTGYSQRSYYLASVADKVYLNPQGNFQFYGFSAQLMYFKGLMDKLGVKANIFYAGKFKSATEPFRRSDMTPENRKQMTAFLSGMYDQFLGSVSAARSVPAAELFAIADNGKIRNAKDAETYKLVDGLKYKDEVLDELSSQLGLGEDEEISAVSTQKYYKTVKASMQETSTSTDQIAVIYAEGDIIDGKGDRGSIGGDRYASMVRKIRKKDNVKAIVLRVNSGGGSALASELIWRELELAKAQGIRVVTSMGDVAASGGYYIASNSDKIFAETNTITGSIGVFGMIPHGRAFLENKLGITMDSVKIGRFSTMASMGMYYDFSEEEAAIIQESVDEVYTLFKTRVSAGRKMDMASVDSVAQGRVWLGTKAKEIGLVDELGGLDAAIGSAATLANLEDYRVVSYPKLKSMEDLLLSFGKDKGKDVVIGQLKGSLEKTNNSFVDGLINDVKSLQQMQGVQTRMPFTIVVE